jgi:hypothetical protein
MTEWLTVLALYALWCAAVLWAIWAEDAGPDK